MKKIMLITTCALCFLSFSETIFGANTDDCFLKSSTDFGGSSDSVKSDPKKTELKKSKKFSNRSEIKKHGSVKKRENKSGRVKSFIKKVCVGGASLGVFFLFLKNKREKNSVLVTRESESEKIINGTAMMFEPPDLPSPENLLIENSIIAENVSIVPKIPEVAEILPQIRRLSRTEFFVMNNSKILRNMTEFDGKMQIINGLKRSAIFLCNFLLFCMSLYSQTTVETVSPEEVMKWYLKFYY